MAEVLHIERESFAYPWTEEDFIRVLRQRNCIGMVIESDFDVIGYMVYELHKTRLVALNLAVHPDRRRQGVGSQLVDKLISKLGSRRNSIELEVADFNLDAQLFFASQGFVAMSVIRIRYDSGADSYLFEYRGRVAV
jgi:ribosomal-protein-alanine N-acetyltransferase